MNDSLHQPVLYKEIIHALQPHDGGRYVDGTLGAGGHARGIMEASAPDGRLLGLDVDPQALALARKNLAPYEQRIHLAQASYISLSMQLVQLQWDAVDGILLDLGASSMQFDTPERGFSFLQDATSLELAPRTHGSGTSVSADTGRTQAPKPCRKHP